MLAREDSRDGARRAQASASAMCRLIEASSRGWAGWAVEIRREIGARSARDRREMSARSAEIDEVCEALAERYVNTRGYLAETSAKTSVEIAPSISVDFAGEYGPRGAALREIVRAAVEPRLPKPTPPGLESGRAPTPEPALEMAPAPQSATAPQPPPAQAPPSAAAPAASASSLSLVRRARRKRGRSSGRPAWMTQRGLLISGLLPRY